MSVPRLFLVNPYNDTHIQMIKEYERRNNISNNTAEELKAISLSMSEESYLSRKKNSNEITERLFLEKDSIITDYCHIQGEKDIKTGRITLSPKKSTTKSRKMISLAVKYALESLNLEEVFIMINPSDKENIQYLREIGYEYLGEEQGNILFLKEKEERIENKRMIS